eukprot:scaffold478_cov80-Skeletonema_marinoi.AAC.1
MCLHSYKARSADESVTIFIDNQQRLDVSHGGPRGKPLKGFGDDSSSSDSEDGGFAAISKKKGGKKRPRSDNPPSSASNEKNTVDANNNTTTSALPSTETSSNKRHHHANASRQAKMDALLEELQTTKPTDPATSQAEDYGSIYAHEASYHGD